MTDHAVPRAGRREWIGLAVLTLASLVYAMDLTVLHLAVPTISAELHPTSAQLLWIIDIYGFLVVGSLITMGTLGDRMGRRRLLMIGTAAFAAISIVAAYSTSPEMLIASRAAMGLAGATVAPSTLSLIFNMFAEGRQRAVAIGVWITSFSAGGAIGPVLGGVLLERLWWGSVFLLAVPVMVLLLILGPRVLPEFRAPDAGRLDIASAALSLTAVLLVIYALKHTAESGFGVVSAAALAAGLALGATFWRRQRRLADPMIDTGLFRSRVFNVSLATNMIAILVAFGYFLFVAQYLQLVLGFSPLQAGLWSLPSAVGFIAGSNLAPHFVHRLRPAIVLSGGFLLAAAGLLLLTRTGIAAGLTEVGIGSVLISLALSPVFNLTTELIVGSAPPERAGAASGISETAAELGGALGIAILGSIGTAIYRREVADGLPASLPADVATAARDTLGAAVESAAQLPGQAGGALLTLVRQAFVDGLHLVNGVSMVVALAAAILVLATLRRVPGTRVPGAAPELPDDSGCV